MGDTHSYLGSLLLILQYYAISEYPIHDWKAHNENSLIGDVLLLPVCYN